MIIPFIAAQLLAHVLADFWFQNDRMCSAKSKKAFRSSALGGHIALVFGLSWLFAFSWNFALYALLIAGIHYLVDGLKIKVSQKWPSMAVSAFVIDQIVHFLMITGVSFWYLTENHQAWLLAGTGSLFIVVLGYVLCTKPANVFLKVLLDGFHICTQPGEQELLNAGKLIGIFERLMVITFVLVNQYSAIGFLIAAKSIIRYKDSEKPKTEYVLIGTLYSFGYAILTGVLVRNFL